VICDSLDNDLVCRTLEQFFPDAGVRHRLHYGFAHRYLPQYVHESPEGALRFFCRDGQADPPAPGRDITINVQARWHVFEGHMGVEEAPAGAFAAPRWVSNLRASMLRIANRPAVLVEMPAPERVPQAFFVGIVFDLPTARVFTLERFQVQEGTNPCKPGLLCEWGSDETHANSGRIVPSDAGAFAAAVGALIAGAGDNKSPPSRAVKREPFWRRWWGRRKP
jgi:hypothetical protein